MRSPSGQLATATGGITTTFDATATVYGTEGMIVMPGFTFPGWLRVDRPGRDAETYDFDQTRHRLAWQVDEVEACVPAGLTESPAMPLSASYEVMRVLDRAREQIGLRFPEEAEAL